MALTDTELAVAACKRLKWPSSKTLAVQSMIPAALSNLAKAVARDPARRNLLLTDPATVTLNVTPGVSPSSTASAATDATCDLSSIVETYGVMLDALRYGTIFHQYQVIWDSSDVSTGAPWPSASLIDIADAAGALNTADPVYLQTSGTIPTGLAEDVIYYILKSAPSYGFATTAANAEADTGITISGSGSGGGTIFSEKKLMQWLKSPNQGFSETCLPFEMLQGWLEGYTLHLKGINLVNTSTSDSVLSFNVPYMPKTLADLPAGDDLHQDLIDTLVAVAMTAGIEDEPPMN